MGERNFTKGVSVVICCYNSAARLPETLQHLASQIFPEDFLMEIILVNNASTDDTVECATEFWNKIHLKNALLKITTELQPGQMHARKNGAKAARFETIVFCDDDNRLDKNYIFRAYQLMNSDAMIGAAGGKNLPVTDGDAYPDWFEEYKDYYGMGIPAKTSGDVSYKTFVLGAGLATRKHLFLQAFDDKYPSLLNGRNGEKLGTGDDFEYCKRLLLRGYKLWYDENMVLYHFVPKERLTLAYRDNLMRGIDAAGEVLQEYDLALKIQKKIGKKSKLRLLLLSPFRILLARTNLSKRNVTDEQLIFFYLSPFNVNATSPRAIIKKFIQEI